MTIIIAKIAMIITTIRKATIILGVTIATSITKYISITIVTKTTIAIKNCNYYKRQNDHIIIKVMITTRLIRAIRAMIV